MELLIRKAVHQTHTLMLELTMLDRKRSLKTIIVAITTAVLCLGLIQMASATEKQSKFGSTLSSTFGSTFAETAHRISMTTDGAIASLTVTRAFKNEGLRRDEVSLDLQMPTFASITSASIYDGGEWKKAGFEKTEDADRKYNEKESTPDGRRLLISKYGGGHLIFISPVLPAETVLLSYEVEVEMEYTAQGYSFPWDLAPNGLETANLSAVKFSSDRPIRINATTRFAGEEFILASNKCEEKGLASNCEFFEIDHPVTDDENVTFSFMTKMKPDEVSYELFAPDGSNYNFVSADFSALQVTDELYQVRVVRQNQPGIWRFVATAQTSATRRASQMLKLKLGDVTHTANFGKGQRSEDRIFVLNSALPKGNIRFGTFTSGSDIYSKVDVTIPAKLSELPRSPTMIFLIDSSVSQSRQQLENQLALVKSVTSHTNDEDVVLISYNRHAKKIEFAKDALEETLTSLKEIRLGNGSDIGEALTLAAKHIAQIPSSKPVLVYAMTDLLFKKGMTQAALLPKISSFRNNTTLHVVEVREDSHSDAFYVERDDGIEISGLAHRTQGVSVVAAFPANGAIESDSETLYLVRPNRLERAQLNGFGSFERLNEYDTFSKFEWQAIGHTAVLKGQLWSRPFIMQAKSNVKTNVQTMRYALNETPTDSKLNYNIARQAGVVSEYTSLVKSGDSIPEAARGFGSVTGMGMVGISRSIGCGGVILGSRKGKKAKPDYSRNFEAVAQTCNQKHRGDTAFPVSIETTYSEIVDVVAKKRSEYEKCVVDGVWDKHLTGHVKTGKYTFVFNGNTVSQK